MFKLKTVKLSKEWQLILFFAIAKLVVHFLTYANFELHRDAYLYYAQGEHLSWGYFAVPPSIAFFGKISTLLFGNTTFALRFFPALIGGINLIIIGLGVRELGGKRVAISLACFAYLLSPAYLHSNALFQPVSFNHFYWLLSSYLILLMINRGNPKMWIWIAVAFGFGFLNKHSIVFFYVAFAVSLLISSKRILYKSKYFLLAILLGAVIILPNIIWQYQNNWPVLQHMEELRETQLVHVKYSDFIIDQFLMNAQALLIWMGGLIVLLFFSKEKQFRVFGFTYLFIIVLLLFGSGKSYYSLGIYPILFVFGAFFIEKYVKKYLIPISIAMVISMGVSLYVSLSFDGIPFITFEKAVKKEAFRWEDGVYHDIPQDMADMTGWKEIGEEVAKVYKSLGEENKDNCDIYCHHYGQAGAVMFYGKKDHVPHPISFNGSFVFWSPAELTKDYMIRLSDHGADYNEDSLLRTRFESVEIKTTINNKFFRENGTKIYLCKNPTEEYKLDYKRWMVEERANYGQ